MFFIKRQFTLFLTTQLTLLYAKALLLFLTNNIDIKSKYSSLKTHFPLIKHENSTTQYKTYDRFVYLNR